MGTTIPGYQGRQITLGVGGWETVGGGLWGSPEMEMRLGLGGAQKGRKQN